VHLRSISPEGGSDGRFGSRIRISGGTQTTAALGILLGKNVALERMGTLDLAVLGEIESLLRATVRFQFGHCIFSFLGLLTSYYWCSAALASLLKDLMMYVRS